jgi:hypothetical protein
MKAHVLDRSGSLLPKPGELGRGGGGMVFATAGAWRDDYSTRGSRGSTPHVG